MDSDIWFSLAGCESGPGGSMALLPAGESPLAPSSTPDGGGRVGTKSDSGGGRGQEQRCPPPPIPPSRTSTQIICMLRRQQLRGVRGAST